MQDDEEKNRRKLKLKKSSYNQFENGKFEKIKVFLLILRILFYCQKNSRLKYTPRGYIIKLLNFRNEDCYERMLSQDKRT